MITRLLKTPRFLPLFLTQLLGAFNDNLFKNALVILVTYTLVQSASAAQSLVALAGGVFILPFFIFSATAGQLADKLEKSQLVRWIKLAEVVIMLVAGVGLIFEQTTLLFLTLFLLGVQSTFFGPIKYSLLPEHLHKDELITGNALIEASTFVSILLGTIIGGICIVLDSGAYYVTGLGLLVAFIGLVSSYFIPKSTMTQPNLSISWNIFSATSRIVGFARKDKRVFEAILGIAWFWLVGSAFLAQFPGLSKDILGADAHVVTLLLSLFSVGIGAGSFISERLQKGEISATFVPVGILGISIFVWDLYFATRGLTPSVGLMSLSAFLQSPQHWRIMFDITLIALCGGLFVVPLYAILQYYAAPEFRSRIIAANNIINAIFMVVCAVVLALLLKYVATIPQIFLLIGAINLVVAIYICRLLPDAVVKSVVRFILKTLYQVKVQGLEHYPRERGQSIVVANHVSMLDGLLLAAFLPENYLFAINKNMAEQWWIRPFLSLVDAFPLDPTNPMSIKSLIREVEKNRSCMIFPEGRLTKTGSLMKIYEGPGLIADKTQSPIVPVRIEGAQYTPFSRLKGKVRTRWFPKITLTVLPPQTLRVDKVVTGRQRREAIGQQLYDVMSTLMYSSSHLEQTLFQSLLDARVIQGGKHIIAQDVSQVQLSYRALLMKSSLLRRLLASHLLPGEFVGLLLPNSVSTVVTFFAMQQGCHVPAMLNYTMGASEMLSACETACLRTVITSRKFIDLGKLEEAVTLLGNSGITLLYLEDLVEHLTATDKAMAAWHAYKPQYCWRKQLKNHRASDPAVILFTSGSEGTPKGVMLSHKNLQANRYQLTSKIDFNGQDIAFNALPMFHSFGLTAGTLLPILSGIKVFLYPSPLHYRVIPEVIYDIDATIVFGTDSFLASYARAANPYDFYSVRYIFAGAEKLKAQTRQTYSEKFGVRIFEGYGATEASPALAMNTPMHNRIGSVGRLLPQIEHRLDPVPGIEQGGRLWVRGDNIMLGYLRHENPGVCQPVEGGWYDTGDIVDIDDDGFLSIIGRVKRFAKIAGEMVSLTAVEAGVNQCWPEGEHVVVAIPDAKKGEQLVCVTTHPAAERAELLQSFKAQGRTEITCPKVCLIVPQLPLLGSGKIDYPSVSALVVSQLANENNGV